MSFWKHMINTQSKSQSNQQEYEYHYDIHWLLTDDDWLIMHNTQGCRRMIEQELRLNTRNERASIPLTF